MSQSLNTGGGNAIQPPSRPEDFNFVGFSSERIWQRGDLPEWNVPLFVPRLPRFRAAEARVSRHVNKLASQQTGRKAEPGKAVIVPGRRKMRVRITVWEHNNGDGI